MVSVADADTITVLDATNTQHKIRLEGIDAPEKSQDYGTKATDALKAAIGGNPVRVVTTGRDKYGREMGTVFVGDQNLNSWLVENGWAWHYKKVFHRCQAGRARKEREDSPCRALGRF